MNICYRTASGIERNKDSSCVIAAIKSAYGFEGCVFIPLATVRGSVMPGCPVKVRYVMSSI
jgi:hypothetical protein